MAGRLLIGSLVGALILMVWGAVFWMASPFAKQILLGIPDEDAVLEVLDRTVPETGVYFLPMPPSGGDADQESFLEKHKRGPLARISIRKEGVDAQSPMVFVKGFIHFFVSTLLISSIMTRTFTTRSTYRSRVFFIFMVGLFAAFFTHLSDPIWMHAPLKYSVYYMDYHILGWLFVGLAIAPIIKPRSE